MDDQQNLNNVKDHSRYYPLWLYATLGGVAGFFITQVTHQFDMRENTLTVLLFSLLAVFVTLGNRQHRFALPVSIAFGTLITGTTLWWAKSGYFTYGIDLRDIFLVFAIVAIAIGTAFIQSWRHDKPFYTYGDLFANAWNNVFIIKFASLFMGAFLLVLLLGTVLFEQVGISWFTDNLWDKDVTPVFMGALLGMGIAISRLHHQVIFKIRQLAFALLKVLALFAAVIVIGFSITLPVTYETLFSEGSTSVILLTLVGVSILLLNTVVDRGSHKLPNWQNYLLIAQVVLLPILSSLSVYAVLLRINQYGYMPQRLVALIIAVLLTLYSITYFVQWVRKGNKWSVGLIEWNPVLAGTTLLVILLIFTKVIDPVAMSINDQLSRLQTGKVSVAEFDFYALKNRLGDPGKEAIKEIESWGDHPEIAQIRIAIKDEQTKDKRKANRKANITVIPDGLSNEDIKKYTEYRSWNCERRYSCLIKMLPVGSHGELYPVRFEFKGKDSVKALVMNRDSEGNLNVLKSFERQPLSEGQYERFVDKIKNADIQTHVPKIRDIEVEGIRFRPFNY